MTAGHLTAIESSFLLDGWHACCSCGWQAASRRATSAEATADTERHLDDVAQCEDPEAPS